MATPLVDAATSAAASVIADIDALFASGRCQHAYLDVGTNLGVQLRKLFEPERYRGAPVLRVFHEAFGPPPWCRVCALGAEPNPLHRSRLDELERAYRGAGVPLKVLRLAAGTSHSAVPFVASGGEAPWVRSLHLGAQARSGAAAYDAAPASQGGRRGEGPPRTPADLRLEPACRASSSSPSLLLMHSGPPCLGAALSVGTFDLAAVLHRVHHHLKVAHGGRRGGAKLVMKLDIEGGEYTVMTHLLHTQALCTVDHSETPPSTEPVSQSDGPAQGRHTPTTHARARCLRALRAVFVEWHPPRGNPSAFGGLRAARKLNASARAALAHDDAAASGGELLQNSTQLLQALFNGHGDPACRTRLDSLDDETFKKDGVPWPTKPLCPAAE